MKKNSIIKKLVKTGIAAAVLACVVSFAPEHAFAKEAITKSNFDYSWYIAKHQDLAAIMSADDKDAIWEFYESTGEPNGWYGRPSMESYITSTNMDYDTFLAQNQDVYALYGNDYDKVYKWYKKYGVKEGRTAQTTNDEINTRINMYTMAGTIFTDGMSDREKIKAVHDWIINNTSYDQGLSDESYSFAGVIKNKKGVCQGYSETFEAFMDIAGIECEIVRGTATNSRGSTGAHAWNKVKVDGNWLYIDVTWDDPVCSTGKNILRYDYFLISEDKMNANHTAYANPIVR